MWLLMSRSFSTTVLIVATIALAGCPVADDEHQRFQMFMQMPDSEKATYFRGLSPEQQVDLYMYSITELRPSDHYLVQHLELTDPTVVDQLVDRLRAADSPRSTFGLVYALHGVSKIDSDQWTKVKAIEACDRFYSRPSPCHQLADDIDRVNVRNQPFD